MKSKLAKDLQKEGDKQWEEQRKRCPVGRVVIKPCPCGESPDGLCITDAGQGGKWANVAGNCCGEWMIEFRTQYLAQDGEGCMKLAIEAWNETKRA